MYHAFNNELAPLSNKTDSGLQSRGIGSGGVSSKRSYGSLMNISHTMYAVNRTNMFDSLNDQSSMPMIPSDMQPVWSQDEIPQPGPSDDSSTRSKQQHPMYRSSDGGSIDGGKTIRLRQQREELFVRQRQEQQAQETRQARERAVLQEEEDFENCRVFLSSPSNEGDSSPLEK